VVQKENMLARYYDTNDWYVDAIDSALDKTGEYADKALDALEAIAIVGFGLFLLAALECYGLGRKFRVWTDRLVADSLPLEIDLDWLETWEEEETHEATLTTTATETITRTPDYETLSIRQLKRLASEAKIKGYGTMKKCELLAALNH